MPRAVPEKFTHGTRRIRRDVLHGRRFRGRGRHHDRVIHRAGVSQRLYDLRDRRALLPNATINADQVTAALIDDGVENDRGLAGLPVADDQLALAAANRNHRINRLQTRRHRLAHRLAINYAGSNALDRVVALAGNRAFVVNRLPKRVDDPPNHAFADRHAHNAASALDLVALLDLGVIAEQHHADLVF